MSEEATWALVESNKRLMETMAMHWANQQAMINKEELPYNYTDFSNLAWNNI